jgi:hypothetical protein
VGGVKKCFLGLRPTALLSAEGKKKVAQVSWKGRRVITETL